MFETYWPQFLEKFSEIQSIKSNDTNVVKRTSDDILLEVLASTRSFDKRLKYIEYKDNNKLNKDYNNYMNNSKSTNPVQYKEANDILRSNEQLEYELNAPIIFSTNDKKINENYKYKKSIVNMAKI